MHLALALGPVYCRSVRQGMNCGHDEVPDNGTLCIIAFVSKSLSSTEVQYNIEREALGVLYEPKKISSLLLC